MQSEILRVKEAVDIVALIGERVKLTRAGKNFKGLCPFHSEKSPSFFVTPELGRYKCFGCQEAGDCFTFLQKVEGISFAESLRELAKRAGITLSNVPLTPEDKKKDKLLEILSLTSAFYHYILTEHKLGEPARKYLEERGIHQDTIKLFQLGFAPDSWEGLTSYLVRKKQFSETDVIDVGLILRSQKGRVYDRFRGRIMFPLSTPRGQVVGFSGRLLEKNAKEAKYINNPETSLYHKSELLFGYSQLSSRIRQEGEVIVCEGEFDVISSVQAHVDNVVAIKGSALTQQQIKTLSYSASKVLLALDADSAGIEATKRAIRVVVESGLDVQLRVLPLEGGKDPDEIAKENPAKWRETVKTSVSVYEYLISVAFTRSNPKTGDGKREITQELAPLLSQIPNAVEQAHYIQQVAKRLGVSEQIFLQEMQKAKTEKVFGLKLSKTPKKQKETPHSRYEVLEKYLFIQLLGSDQSEFFSRFELLRKSQVFQGSYERLLESLAAIPGAFNPASVVTALPPELVDVYTTLYMESTLEQSNRENPDEFSSILQKLQEIRAKEKVKHIATRIGEIESKEKLTEDEEAELKKLRHSLVSVS